MVCLAQTVHLSSIKIVSISKWNEIRFYMTRHLVVPLCASKLIFEPVECSMQTLHLSCTDTNTVSKWTEMRFPHDPHHLGVSSSACKIISEPMVCLVQIAHLSCVKISTVSKRTKTSFCLSLITKEYHRVHLKWFLSLWYVRRKPGTYVASRLALSPYTLKQDSTWPTSPSSSIVCVQNDFWACGMFHTNSAPVLHRH
jgi:hypothetical protein